MPKYRSHRHFIKIGANVGQFTDIYSEYGDFMPLLEVRYTSHTNRVSITPLMYAAYFSTEEVISFLIKKGAKVNSKNKDGRTALMYVSEEDLVDLLIKNKANVNAKDKGGRTALMYACIGYTLNLNTVKLLVRAGANVNDVDKYGETALMRAIWTYKYTASDNLEFGVDELDFSTLPIFETIRFLIYNGANVNIKNKDGETPLSLAGGFPKLTKLLKDNGAY